MNNFLAGMKPVPYPTGAKHVAWGRRGNYVRGFVTELPEHVIVTDCWNGVQTKIHRSRINTVRELAA